MQNPPEDAADRFSNYGALKSELAEIVIEHLTVIQSRIKDISGDPCSLQINRAAKRQVLGDLSRVAITLHPACNAFLKQIRPAQGYFYKITGIELNPCDYLLNFI